MTKLINNFTDFINESKFPNEIKSEKYWRSVISGNKYANEVLDTIMHKQDGYASDKQLAILKRAERGDSTSYHSKN